MIFRMNEHWLSIKFTKWHWYYTTNGGVIRLASAHQLKHTVICLALKFYTCIASHYWCMDEENSSKLDHSDGYYYCY